MRRKIVAGNWKMNKTLTDSVALAKDLKAAMADMPVCGVEMVVAPVFTNISAVAQELKGTGVAVAAQNIYPKASGAYTGEVSAPIAKSAGASKVILGHSERRQYFGETDQFLAEKTDAALAGSYFLHRRGVGTAQIRRAFQSGGRPDKERSFPSSGIGME